MSTKKSYGGEMEGTGGEGGGKWTHPWQVFFFLLHLEEQVLN